MDNGRSRAQFRVLGPFEVSAGGRGVPVGGARQRLVLAALLASANEVVSADRLIDIVWGDDPPDSALSTVQKYVYRLRAAIDPGRAAADPAGRLVTRAPGYLLRVEADDCDAARFERVVGDAQRRAAGGDLAGATAGFDEALRLWRGPAWAEFADHDFARADVARLDGLRAVAVEDRAEVALAAGRHAEVIGELEGTAASWPLRERPRAQLMLALYRCGRHAEALRVYEGFRRHLADEVGLEPSAALVHLADAMLVQKPELDWVRQPLEGAGVGIAGRPGSAPAVGGPGPDQPVTLPSGTVTFLFIDIEGSTRLFRRLGHRFVAVLERHRELLRGAVAEQRGVEVNADGDGLLFAFAGAAAALAASAAGQRALTEERWEDGPLQVRMGVHTGEAAPHAGDYIAMAVHQAARVEQAAHGGQVLVSQATVAAVGDELPEGCSVRDLGRFPLKDFEHGVELFQLCHVALLDTFPTPRVQPATGPIGSAQPPSLPDALTSDAGPFVGRDVELEWLEVLWRRAAAGERLLALIWGRSGVGKTRLVAEFARSVHARGGIVTYHRGEVPISRSPQAGADGATGGSPVLVIVDDLDAPDPAVLLEQAEAGDGTLVVGVSAQLPAGHPGRPVDGGAAPPRPVMVRELGGLSVHEVGLLLGHGAGPQPAELAEAVLAETGGVPSLVADVAGRLRDREAADRVERALSRAGAANRELRSVQDDIIGGVMRRGRLAAAAPADGVTPGPGVCPYRGLARFDAADAPYFFGRERLVATLVARLAVARFVAVIGASGSGKSSLVRAGLLPALAAGALPGSENWSIAVCTPGSEPTARLADALSPLVGIAEDQLRRRLDADPEELIRVARGASRLRPDARLLVVVDQFEELATVCRDLDERQRFVAGLVAAVIDPDSPIAVVPVVRADYYGALAAHPELARLFEQSQVLVGAMTDTELHRAVAEPARRVGLGLQAGLADAVCRDAAGEPGALPLVSTALLETWVRRDHDTLTLAGYDEAGGVRGALARLAEEVYAGVDDNQQVAARQLFLRLAEPGEGTNDVRRRAAREELRATEEADSVLAAFVQRRLLVADDGFVEVAHEALLREWPRLRGWLEADREGRRLHSQLAQAAVDWDTGGRDPDALYRGTRLNAAQDWNVTHASDLNAVERAFLDASVAYHDRELRSARRTARHLRSLAIGLAVVLVAALLAGLGALVQRGDARRQASQAHTQARRAEASRLATLASTLGPDQIDVALLAGVEGHRLFPSSDTEGGLEAALVHTPPGLDQVIHFDSPTLFPDLSIDGRLLAVPHQDGTMQLWDLPSGRLIRQLAGHPSPSFGAGFSPDNHLVAAGGLDGTVTIADVATGRPVGAPLAVGGPFAYGFFGTDPNRLYTVSSNDQVGQLAVWNLSDAEHPRQLGQPIAFPVEPAGTALGQVSGDGRLVAVTGTVAGPTQIWDVGAHTLLQNLPGTLGGFAPDNITVATGQPGRIVLWNAITGRQQGEPFAGFNGAAGVGPFSPDGRRLSGADPDGTTRVFDVASRQPVGVPLALHANQGFPFRFLPDGRLATAGTSEVAIWRIGATVPPLGVAIGPRAGPTQGIKVPHANEVITEKSDSHQLLRWDATTGAPLGPLFAGKVHAEEWPGVALSPDGAMVAAVGPDAAVGLWDRITGQELAVLDGGKGAHQSALWWSPGGNQVATTASDGSVLLWNVSDPHHPVRTGRVVTGAVPPQDLAQHYISNDGRHLVFVDTSLESVVTMFDLPDGHRQWSARFSTLVGQLAFSPDSKTLAVSVGNPNLPGQVTLYDTATGKVLRALPRPTGPGVDFLRAGRVLITTSNSLSGAGPAPQSGLSGAQLYDTAIMQPIGEPLPMPVAGSWLVVASADGTHAVEGSPNGVNVIWDVDVDRWATTACRIAGRNLTRTEWHQYLPNEPYQPTCPQWPASR